MIYQLKRKLLELYITFTNRFCTGTGKFNYGDILCRRDILKECTVGKGIKIEKIIRGKSGTFMK